MPRLMIDQGLGLSDKQKDCFSVAAILGALLIRFYQTILFGQSLSKAYLTAHWDSIFYALRSGQNFNSDSSLNDIFIPYRFFVAEYWHHGLPLWNQLNGFGMPLLADPQALPFSPLHALFSLFPNMYTWNILLVVELAIAGIGVYFLCREVRLNFIAGLIAALLFIFCPFLQWQIELTGTGFCLTPFVFLLFTRMAKKGSLWNIVFAGIAAAIDIASSHPEIAFVTILFVSIWACFVACYTRESTSLLSSLSAVLSRIALAGLITFGLCAPMLIPFVEYLANCESYKLQTITAGLSWQVIFANYLFPFQPKASLFFGVLSLWGLIASFIFFDKSNRLSKALIICFFISLIGVIRPFPFNILFQIPPLSMTFASYWLPEYFLFVSILSGLGCSYLIEKLFTNSLFDDKKIFILVAIGVILLAIPLIYRPWQLNNSLILDNTFEQTHFSWKFWLFNAGVALAALLVLFSGINKSLGRKVFVTLVFIALGFISLISNSFDAAPIRPSFKYPDNLPFAADERKERILSVGNHLLKPDTNLIYRLPLLQASNPIFPKGFIGFIEACGAQVDQYKQLFSPCLSPLLAVAGVNKIISQQPVLDKNLLRQQDLDKSRKLSAKVSAGFENLLSLSDARVFYDAKASSIFLRTKVVLHSAEDYYLCFAVEDAHGKQMSYTEPVSISSGPLEQEIICSALIPEAAEKNWFASIRIMRVKGYRFLNPSRITAGKIRSDKSWLIASHDQAQTFTKINNDRFELVCQHGSVLEYKDKTAFKRYFFVKEIVWVDDNAAALNYLKSHTEQLKNVAVLEKQDFEEFKNNSTDSKNFESGVIDFAGERDKPFATATEFTFKTEGKTPSFLVDSDIYYPGWNVYIDEKNSKIFRTNYLFRGIIIPAGHHTIKFVYQPISLAIGVWLFFITIGIILILGFRQLLISRKGVSIYNNSGDKTLMSIASN